ncbi:uncharacterized protein LOC143914336 [Arctopsyche grandis]|uniref:uncharacterized protein LOC143914336 n=1 Tax=Arctopsyche grandis TaxID=121162 RepID=UPI00406D9559
MFKLVVLFAVVAVASAKPNLLASGLVAPGLVGGWGAPLAVSRQSRIDVVSSPVVSQIAPWGLSSSVVSSPVVSAYSAVPAWNSGLVGGLNAWNGLATPVVSSIGEPALIPGSPAGVVKVTGKLVDTADVVIARNNHLVARNLAAHGIQKRSVISPLAYSSVVSPIAPWGLSSSVVSSPVVSAYSAVPAWNSGLVGGLNAWNSGLIGGLNAWNGLASPVVSSIGEPALIPGSPAGVVKTTGKLVDTADVVIARNNHLVAKSLAVHGIQKRSVISPLAYSSVASPIAPWGLSSSVVSSPVVSAYSAVPAWNSGLVGGLNAWNSGLIGGLNAWNGLASPVVSSIGEPALIPGSPAGVVKTTGKLVDTADVVIARNNHLVAKSLAVHGIQKRSAISPLAYSSVVSPIAPLGLASPLISSPLISSPILSRQIISGPVVSPWAARSIVSPISPIGVHGIRAW